MLLLVVVAVVFAVFEVVVLMTVTVAAAGSTMMVAIFTRPTNLLVFCIASLSNPSSTIRICNRLAIFKLKNANVYVSLRNPGIRTINASDFECSLCCPQQDDTFSLSYIFKTYLQ